MQCLNAGLCRLYTSDRGSKQGLIFGKSFLNSSEVTRLRPTLRYSGEYLGFLFRERIKNIKRSSANRLPFLLKQREEFCCGPVMH